MGAQLTQRLVGPPDDDRAFAERLSAAAGRARAIGRAPPPQPSVGAHDHRTAAAFGVVGTVVLAATTTVKISATAGINGATIAAAGGQFGATNKGSHLVAVEIAQGSVTTTMGMLRGGVCYPARSRSLDCHTLSQTP